jgi:hypothetical protein
VVGCGSPQRSAVAEIAGIRERRRQRRYPEFVGGAGAMSPGFFALGSRVVR